MKKLLFFILLLPIFCAAQIVRPSVNIIDVNPGPNIRITGSSLFPFTNVSGVAPAPQTETFTAGNLVVNLVFTAGSGMEISKDGVSYSTTLTYIPVSGAVSGIIYVRTAAATAPGPYSGTIHGVSLPATPADIPYTATVSSPAASLSVSPTSISGVNSVAGTAGPTSTFTVTFANITGNDTVTSFTPVEVSQDGGTTFASRQIFSTGSPKTITIRNAATATPGAVSGNIVVSAAGVIPNNVAVTGTVSGSSGAADTARFAMSLSNLAVPTGFVGLSGDPVTGIRTATNAAATITISTVATANWAPLSGSCAYDDDGKTGSTASGFPDNILYRGHYTYSGSAGTSDSTSLTLAKPQYKISGLNTAATYTVKLTASLDNTRFGLTCNNKYRIVGGATYVSALFNALGNTSGLVTFPSVIPDGTGAIKIYMFTESGQEIAITAGAIIYKN